MTKASFCDIHPDQNTSLIRAGTVYTLTVSYTEKKQRKGDKKAQNWIHEAQVNACPACVKRVVFDSAKGLGLDMNSLWKIYRLYKKDDGKYAREDYDSNKPDEDELVTPPTS